MGWVSEKPIRFVLSKKVKKGQEEQWAQGELRYFLILFCLKYIFQVHTPFEVFIIKKLD